MTWKQWLTKATGRLQAPDNLRAQRDAEILLGQVTGEPRTRLLAFGETVLTVAQYTQLEALLQRRELGEPIAYLIGECEFWSMRLKVSTDTLIPRPETECVVQRVLDLLPVVTPVDILDLGTGTGAIALALASERPTWRITGIDCQCGALVLAKENAIQLGLKNIQFFKSDWFQLLQGNCYNLIVSNPPYIKSNDIHLFQGDVRFEPHSALVSGKNGLSDLMMICHQAGEHLQPGGWLVLEHGWKQGKIVRDLLSEAGFICITTVCDYNHNERVSQGQWFPNFGN
ncbi:peptide chain release factor N(5)-glutamine methyltransferase [Candidatus Curculioniphilus buchneri]|uniref:peptide chain release factor N(5)-glutamine methyltransferase n=1 Tax=Candidatus Curculioniphilus buchneri TaxID=690594 RepID=UPI00376F275E